MLMLRQQLGELLTVFLFLTSNRKGGPGDFRVHNDPVQVKRSDATYYNNGVYDLRNAIRFRLWTRENPILANEIVVHDVQSLRTSTFNSKRITKIFLHGKDQRADEQRLDPETVYLRDAYLRFADVNFVLVDWTSMAKNFRYFTHYGDIVSDRLVQFIRFIERHGTPMDQIHLLGLSWGAHVSGNAGRILKGKVGRITGLDPAGPFYIGLPRSRILDRSDAQFVDIIHTDGGGAIGLHSGILDPTGHVDYYPNGGQHQPGCPPRDYKHYKGLPCSHERSVDLFSESIGSPLSFPSCKRSSWDEYQRSQDCDPDQMTFMGEHIPRTTRGIFYLKTAGGRPFGLGTKMDIILPNIPGARRSRNFVFDISRFRFMRLTSNDINNPERSGSPIPLTETNFSPSNETNVALYDNYAPYTPQKYPNNEILIESITLMKQLLLRNSNNKNLTTTTSTSTSTTDATTTSTSTSTTDATTTTTTTSTTDATTTTTTTSTTDATTSTT